MLRSRFTLTLVATSPQLVLHYWNTEKKKGELCLCNIYVVYSYYLKKKPHTKTKYCAWHFVAVYMKKKKAPMNYHISGRHGSRNLYSSIKIKRNNSEYANWRSVINMLPQRASELNYVGIKPIFAMLQRHRKLLTFQIIKLQ